MALDRCSSTSLAPFSAANRTEAKGTQEESEFRSRSDCAKKKKMGEKRKEEATREEKEQVQSDDVD